MNDFDILILRNKSFGVMHSQILAQRMIFPWDDLRDSADWRTAGININDLVYMYSLRG